MSNKNDNEKNKKVQGPSRNLSNRMYGNEEGDEKPGAARSGEEGENIPTQEGAVEKSADKDKISYEPDKNDSGAQGAFGQGNALDKGEEGAQGYGKYEEEK
jgi:hypothetical protein